MESSPCIHTLTLAPAQDPGLSMRSGIPSIPLVLASLKRQPGVLDATFDPSRSVADVVIDSDRISLGDVVRLLEDAGVGVSAVARIESPPVLAVIRA